MTSLLKEINDRLRIMDRKRQKQQQEQYQGRMYSNDTTLHQKRQQRNYFETIGNSSMTYCNTTRHYLNKNTNSSRNNNYNDEADTINDLHCYCCHLNNDNLVSDVSNGAVTPATSTTISNRCGNFINEADDDYSRLEDVALPDSDYMNFSEIAKCVKDLPSYEVANDTICDNYNDYNYYYYPDHCSDKKRFIFEDIPEEILRIVDDLIEKDEDITQHFHLIDQMAFRHKFFPSSLADKDIESDTDSGNGTLQTENDSCSSQTLPDVFNEPQKSNHINRPPEIFVHSQKGSCSIATSSNANFRSSKILGTIPTISVLPPPDFLGDLTDLPQHYSNVSNCTTSSPSKARSRAQTDSVEILPPPLEFSGKREEYGNGVENTKRLYSKADNAIKGALKKKLPKSAIVLDKIPGSYLSQSCIDLSQGSPRRRVTFADEVSSQNLELIGSLSDNEEGAKKGKKSSKLKAPRPVSETPTNNQKTFSAFKLWFKKQKAVEEKHVTRVENDKNKKTKVQVKTGKTQIINKRTESNDDPFSSDEFDEFSSDEDLEDGTKTKGVDNNDVEYSYDNFLLAFDPISKPPDSKDLKKNSKNFDSSKNSRAHHNKVKLTIKHASRPTSKAEIPKKKSDSTAEAKHLKRNSCNDMLEKQHKNVSTTVNRNSDLAVTALHPQRDSTSKASSNPLKHLMLKLGKKRTKDDLDKVSSPAISPKTSKPKSQIHPQSRKSIIEESVIKQEIEDALMSYSDEEYEYLRLSLVNGQTNAPQTQPQKQKSSNSYYRNHPSSNKRQHGSVTPSADLQPITSRRHCSPFFADSTDSVLQSGSISDCVFLPDLSTKERTPKRDSGFETILGEIKPIPWRSDHENHPTVESDVSSNKLTTPNHFSKFRIGHPTSHVSNKSDSHDFLTNDVEPPNKRFSLQISKSFNPAKLSEGSSFPLLLSPSSKISSLPVEVNDTHLRSNQTNETIPPRMIATAISPNLKSRMSHDIKNCDHLVCNYLNGGHNNIIAENNVCDTGMPNSTFFTNFPNQHLSSGNNNVQELLTASELSETTNDDIYLNLAEFGPMYLMPAKTERQFKNDEGLPTDPLETKTTLISQTEKQPLKPKPNLKQLISEPKNSKAFYNGQASKHNPFLEDMLEKVLFEYDPMDDCGYQKALSYCDQLARQLRSLLNEISPNDEVNHNSTETNFKNDKPSKVIDNILLGKLMEESSEKLREICIKLVTTGKNLVIASTVSETNLSNRVAESIHWLAKFSLEAKHFTDWTDANSDSCSVLSQFVCVVDLFELTIGEAEDLMRGNKNGAKLKSLLGLANDLAKELAALLSIINSASISFV